MGGFPEATEQVGAERGRRGDGKGGVRARLREGGEGVRRHMSVHAHARVWV